MIVDQWQNCYDQGWQDNIVPEAFSHPAKFSRGLIRRIYKHTKKMGWIQPGDWVLDPFGGVALGGLDAMSMALNWIGVELEEKFIKLGQQNIELWNRQLKGWPNLGTAKIVQGDSRRLGGIVTALCEELPTGRHICQADLVISSPPFASAQSGGGINKDGYTSRPDLGPDWVGDRTYSDRTAGHTPGNLANMKEGDIDMVVSSPPYAESLNSEKHGIRDGRRVRNNSDIQGTHYGQSPGQLGSMKEGNFDLICSLPPYGEIASGAGGLNTKPVRESGQQSGRNPKSSSQNTDQYYGKSKGQLSGMPEGPFDLCVSSPPYEGAKGNRQHEGDQVKYIKRQEAYRLKHPEFNRPKGESMAYPGSKGNLGNEYGDTFWSASKIILEQCFELLKPNGHAIFICKDYIKAKKRVPFSNRWLSLCESVGFKLVCRHKAMLIKVDGEQSTIRGPQYLKTERKSFFRRNHEIKVKAAKFWPTLTKDLQDEFLALARKEVIAKPTEKKILQKAQILAFKSECLDDRPYQDKIMIDHEDILCFVK